VLAYCNTLYYNGYMSKTLTVRTGEEIRDALQRRADAQGKTVSEVVREILEEALAERPLEYKAGHLKGRLELPSSKDAWRKQLKERNWRS
jgi:predicted DNA-binding protein